MLFSKASVIVVGLAGVLMAGFASPATAQGYGGAWNRGYTNLPHFGRGLNDAIIRPVYPRGGFVTPPRRYVPRTRGPVPHRLGRFGNYVPKPMRPLYNNFDRGYRTMVPKRIQRDMRNVERRFRNERKRVTDNVNREYHRTSRRVGREARRVWKKIKGF